jgi:hypothetical protein
MIIIYKKEILFNKITKHNKSSHIKICKVKIAQDKIVFYQGNYLIIHIETKKINSFWFSKKLTKINKLS